MKPSCLEGKNLTYLSPQSTVPFGNSLLIPSVCFYTPREPRCTRPCLHILHHDVLVRDESINAVVPSFPPVFRGSMVQEKGSSFFERELSCRSSDVVKLGYSFYGLALWVGREKERLSDPTQAYLYILVS